MTHDPVRPLADDGPQLTFRHRQGCGDMDASSVHDYPNRLLAPFATAHFVLDGGVSEADEISLGSLRLVLPFQGINLSPSLSLGR